MPDSRRDSGDRVGAIPCGCPWFPADLSGQTPGSSTFLLANSLSRSGVVFRRCPPGDRSTGLEAAPDQSGWPAGASEAPLKGRRLLARVIYARASLRLCAVVAVAALALAVTGCAAPPRATPPIRYGIETGPTDTPVATRTRIPTRQPPLPTTPTATYTVTPPPTLTATSTAPPPTLTRTPVPRPRVVRPAPTATAVPPAAPTAPPPTQPPPDDDGGNGEKPPPPPPPGD